MSSGQSVVRRAARVSLTEHAIEEIRSAISSGNWPVGDRIPSETQLSTDLGVGRTSVREAIRALAHSGLLEVKRGDGTYVKAQDETQVALRRRFRTARARDVIEVRRGIDVMIARNAARNRRDDEVVELRRSLEARNQVADQRDPDAFALADAQFHQLVARLTHNEVMLDLYIGLADAIQASIRPDNCPTGYADDPEDSHALLVQAISVQDEDLAETAVLRMLDHQGRLLDGSAVFETDPRGS